MLSNSNMVDWMKGTMERTITYVVQWVRSERVVDYRVGGGTLMDKVNNRS